MYKYNIIQCNLNTLNLHFRQITITDNIFSNRDVIRTNLKFGNRAFSVSGPREWNSLPASVRQCTSVVQFKSKLKTQLFSLYYYY